MATRAHLLTGAEMSMYALTRAAQSMRKGQEERGVYHHLGRKAVEHEVLFLNHKPSSAYKTWNFVAGGGELFVFSGVPC